MTESPRGYRVVADGYTSRAMTTAGGNGANARSNNAAKPLRSYRKSDTMTGANNQTTHDIQNTKPLSLST